MAEVLTTALQLMLKKVNYCEVSRLIMSRFLATLPLLHEDCIHKIIHHFVYSFMQLNEPMQ